MRIKNYLMITVALFVLICVVLGTLSFIGLAKLPFVQEHSITVEKPLYTPEGYLSVVNSTSDNKNVFIFEDNEKNHFIVAATRDLKKTNLEKLSESFHKTEGNNTKLVEEKIVINGHNAVFQVMTLEVMEMQVQMFHVSWYCDNGKFNMFATGTMKLGESNEMKRMVQSIKCH